MVVFQSGVILQAVEDVTAFTQFCGYFLQQFIPVIFVAMKTVK